MPRRAWEGLRVFAVSLGFRNRISPQVLKRGFRRGVGTKIFHPLDGYTQIAYNTYMIFIETSIFTKRITESVSDEDYHKLQVLLAEHPDAGDLIRGSGGIRKIRCAASGRGKRGGARTLYYWDVPDKIYMIFCYLKNERENITPEQLKALKKLVEENLK